MASNITNFTVETPGGSTNFNPGGFQQLEAKHPGLIAAINTLAKEALGDTAANISARVKGDKILFTDTVNSTPITVERSGSSLSISSPSKLPPSSAVNASLRAEFEKVLTATQTLASQTFSQNTLDPPSGQHYIVNNYVGGYHCLSNPAAPTLDPGVQRQLEQIDDALTRLEKIVTDLEQKVTAFLASQNQAAPVASPQNVQERQQLHEALGYVGEQNQVLQNRLSLLENEVVKLKAENRHLRSEPLHKQVPSEDLAAAKREIGSLQHKAQAQQTTIHSLQTQLSQAQSSAASEKELNTNLRGQMGLLKEENFRLQAKLTALEALERMYQEQTAQLAEAQSNIFTLSSELAAQQALIDSLNTRLSKASSEGATQADLIKDLELKKTEAEAKIRSLEVELTAQAEQSHASDEALRITQARLEKTQKEFEQFQQDLEALGEG